MKAFWRPSSFFRFLEWPKAPAKRGRTSNPGGPNRLKKSLENDPSGFRNPRPPPRRKSHRSAFAKAQKETPRHADGGYFTRSLSGQEVDRQFTRKLLLPAQSARQNRLQHRSEEENRLFGTRQNPLWRLTMKSEHWAKDFGTQPLEALLTRLGLTNADLVRASTQQLSFKMVQRGRKGRKLTPNIQRKILNALHAAAPDTSF